MSFKLVSSHDTHNERRKDKGHSTLDIETKQTKKNESEGEIKV